jgi:TP901 family phage tail tape measure protein
VNAGAIVYEILMKGAAAFKKDSADADQAMQKLGQQADTSAQKVSKNGEEIDKTGEKARKSKAPLEELGKKTEETGKKSEDAKPKVKSLGEEFTQMDSKTQNAARNVGAAGLAIATAIALVAGMAVAKYADFEVATDKTAAAAQASVSQSKQLSAAAIEAGSASQYSATQAANAQTELIKAGLSVNDVLAGGLTGSLALAAAGELDVARAASIAATTLSVFKLEGKDAGHVADLLAAGAGKAQGSVDDLSLALEYVGPTFARLKIPLEQTVGTLGLLASNGILGEKAGTGLRSTIQSLTAPVAKGAEVMKQYGINVFDAQGNFIGLQGAAEQLKQGLGGLDEEQRSAALGAIFGAEAANVAGTLYEAGAEGVAKWTSEVNDAGYASQQAYQMTDNLTGDVERLGGAFDSALISTGAAANGVLREMVQTVTAAVDSYNQLDPALQGVALGGGALAASVIGGAGAFLIAIPKIAEFKNSLDTLQESMPKTAAAGRGVASFLTGPWGIAFAAASVAALIGLQSLGDYNAEVESLSSTLDQNTGALTDNTRAAVAKQLQDKGILDAAKGLGLSLDTITDAALGNKDAMEKVKAAQDAYNASADEGTRAVEGIWEGFGGATSSGIVGSLEEIGGQLDKGKVKLLEMKDATEENSDAQSTAADAYLGAADYAEDLLDTLSQLVDKINEANGINQDAVSANADYLNALSGITAEVESQRSAYEQATGSAEGFSLTLDETTASGSANADMLSQVAAKAQEAAAAQFEVDKTTMSAKDATDKYVGTLNSSRDAFIAGANAAGFNSDQVQALANKVFALPSAKEIEIVADTANATRQINDWVSIQNGKQVHIAVGVGGAGGITQADGGKVNFYANGGRENHIAQFARAGTYRVWAEQETGGEWYIPAAMSKRGRSTEVMRAAANEFGYDLVPRGARSFADGGSYGVAGGGNSAGTVMEGNLYLDSGEFLGRVRGEVHAVISEENQSAAMSFAGGIGR